MADTIESLSLTNAHLRVQLAQTQGQLLQLQLNLVGKEYEAASAEVARLTPAPVEDVKPSRPSGPRPAGSK